MSAQGDWTDHFLVGGDLVDKDSFHIASVTFTPRILWLGEELSPTPQLVPALVDGNRRLGRAGVGILDLFESQRLYLIEGLHFRRAADFCGEDPTAEAGAG